MVEIIRKSFEGPWLHTRQHVESKVPDQVQGRIMTTFKFFSQFVTHYLMAKEENRPDIIKWVGRK